MFGKTKDIKKQSDHVPEMLLILESCIVDELNYAHILQNIPLQTLTEWESESPILSDALRTTNFYEEQCKALYPLTHERTCRMATATSWKRLLCHLQQRPNVHYYQRLWKENLFSSSSLSCFTSSISSLSNELGNNSVHQYFPEKQMLRRFAWNDTFTDSVTQSYFALSKFSISSVQLFSIQEKCLILLNNQELFLVHMHVPKTQLPADMQDLRRWALSHNHFLEHAEDFVLPNLFFGKSTLSVLFASVSNDDCFSVVLNGKIILTFDSKKERKNNSAKQWRHLLTCEVYEPIHCPNQQTGISACAYVLDRYLLVATSDGILRARPRSNPKSEYYIQKFNAYMHQLSSLFNVVAVIHTYHVLEVRAVIETDTDPFLKLPVLYKTTNVDCEHTPLLYGPYVIFKSLDTSWYRVLYDFPGGTTFEKEEIRIPHHPEWKILSIKNANFKFLTVVVLDSVVKRSFEVFLFSDF
jgi:hypothetical protein